MLTKTVLILGAGASAPYGFPSGNQLVENIIDSLSPTYTQNGKDIFQDKVLANILLTGFSVEHINNFRNSLRNSQTNSIDGFLNYRKEFVEIGKMSIIFHLLHAEHKSIHDLNHNGDWYQYLWNKINPYSKEKYCFSFYTFNYDRSLSFFLRKSAENLFGIAGDELKQYLDSIPIHHLHGNLGSMEFGDINSINNFEKLKTQSSNINIIFEVDDMTVFEQLKKELKHANNIVFLGFGFHPDNMKRMGFPIINFPSNKEIPTIYASTYKLTTKEVHSMVLNDLAKAYNEHYQSNPKNVGEKFIGGKTEQGNLDFIRENFPFEELLN